MEEKTIEVIAGDIKEWQTGKHKGEKYLEVSIKSRNGIYSKNIFDKDAQSQFSGPGKYIISTKREGDFFNIVGFKKIEHQENAVLNGKQLLSASVEPNAELTRKSICAQVAAKTAGEIVSALLVSTQEQTSLRFKSREEIVIFTAQLIEAIAKEIRASSNEKNDNERKTTGDSEIVREKIL